MKKERLNELKHIHHSEEMKITAAEVDELFEAIDDLRKGYEWIKMMENDFYDQVRQTEFGELRSLNPNLTPWAYKFQSLFGTVNEALNPRFENYKGKLNTEPMEIKEIETMNNTHILFESNKQK